MDDDTPERTAQELLSVLPLLNRIVAVEVRREAGEETTIPQFRVLAHLCDGPLTLSELARRRYVTLQSMSELAQILVERGWIARTPDPHDRRQQLIALTKHGRAHYQRALSLMIVRLIPLLAGLNETETQAVRIALPALHRVLAGEGEPAS
jgi:DNA-binding MarR family transcriptional regulator